MVYLLNGPATTGSPGYRATGSFASSGLTLVTRRPGHSGRSMTCRRPRGKLAAIILRESGSENQRAAGRDPAGRLPFRSTIYQSRTLLARLQRACSGGSRQRPPPAARTAALPVDLGKQSRRI